MNAKGIFDMTEYELNKLKQIEVDLLKVFIDTCNKMGLQYYVVEGTLLGAVRHNGFIPWDDDIDVAMPRADYEIWVHNAQKYIDDPDIFVQTIETDPEYYCNITKLRNSNTTFIETMYYKLNMNHGVYIDIFPLDYYPELPEEIDMFEQKEKELYFKFAKAHYVGWVEGYPKWKVFFRNTMWKVISFVKPDYARNAVMQRDKHCMSVKETSKIANLNSAWVGRNVCPAEWYGDGVEGSFEGISVRLPNEYDKILTQEYGDYMQLPPEEKRVTHHYTTIIDLDKSYKEYKNRKKRVD